MHYNLILCNILKSKTKMLSVVTYGLSSECLSLFQQTWGDLNLLLKLTCSLSDHPLLGFPFIHCLGYWHYF